MFFGIVVFVFYCVYVMFVCLIWFLLVENNSEEKMFVEGVDFDDLKWCMQGVLFVLKIDFFGFCIGCVLVSMLDLIFVDVYGQLIFFNQVGIVFVFELCMVVIQVWDKSMVVVVEKVIWELNFGFNFVVDGQLLCLFVLEFNQECWQELIKVVYKYVEQVKVVICYVCCDGMDDVKKVEKDGEILQDDSCVVLDEVQKLIDQMIGEVDSMFGKKEQEIFQV